MADLRMNVRMKSLRVPESTFNLHLLDSESRSCAHLLNVAAGEERQLADDLSDR